MEKTTVNINGTEIELFKPVEIPQVIDDMVPIKVFQKGEEVFNQLLLALDGITVEKKKNETDVSIKWDDFQCEIYDYLGECSCGEDAVVIGSKYCPACGCAIKNPLITKK